MRNAAGFTHCITSGSVTGNGLAEGQIDGDTDTGTNIKHDNITPISDDKTKCDNNTPEPYESAYINGMHQLHHARSIKKSCWSGTKR